MINSYVLTFNMPIYYFTPYSIKGAILHSHYHNPFVIITSLCLYQNEILPSPCNKSDYSCSRLHHLSNNYVNRNVYHHYHRLETIDMLKPTTTLFYIISKHTSIASPTTRCHHNEVLPTRCFSTHTVY